MYGKSSISLDYKTIYALSMSEEYRLGLKEMGEKAKVEKWLSEISGKKVLYYEKNNLGYIAYHDRERYLSEQTFICHGIFIDHLKKYNKFKGQFKGHNIIINNELINYHASLNNKKSFVLIEKENVYMTEKQFNLFAEIVSEL